MNKFAPGVYRNTPIQVEAMQWDGGNIQDASSFIGVIRTQYGALGLSYLRLRTPDGDQMVAPGEWIVKTEKGDLWRYREDDFKSMFIAADTITLIEEANDD